jgi:thiamine kinase-like enzyme
MNLVSSLSLAVRWIDLTERLLVNERHQAHIADAFQRSGWLDRMNISDIVMVSALEKARSCVLRLRLKYKGAVGGSPSTLILKMGRLDKAGRSSYANSHEIAFYRDIAPTMPEQLVPRCLGTLEATDSTTWHLLLEDLTDSHFIATEWPLPPTAKQCEDIVKANARLHATWWDDPRLGASVGSWSDAVVMDQYLQTFADRFGRFTDRFGEMLPPERRHLYERLLDKAPSLLTRYHSRRNLTIIHGDAHPWNFFLPRDDAGRGTRVIDWEDWQIDVATDDLAYMMAMLWYPERRCRMERPLLDLYHAELLTRGVNDYDRQALDDDYRLSTLWLIMRPVNHAMANLHPRVWWNNLERIMLAVDDLDCRALLT